MQQFCFCVVVARSGVGVEVVEVEVGKNGWTWRGAARRAMELGWQEE